MLWRRLMGRGDESEKAWDLGGLGDDLKDAEKQKLPVSSGKPFPFIVDPVRARRDLFAAAALQGLVTEAMVHERGFNVNALADKAWSFANAMLEREPK